MTIEEFNDIYNGSIEKFNEVHENNKFLLLNRKICDLFSNISSELESMTFLNILNSSKFRDNDKKQGLLRESIIQESYAAQSSVLHIESALTELKKLLKKYNLWVSYDPEFDFLVSKTIQIDFENLEKSNSNALYAWELRNGPNKDFIEKGCFQYKDLSDQFIDLISIWKDDIDIPQKIILN